MEVIIELLGDFLFSITILLFLSYIFSIGLKKINPILCKKYLVHIILACLSSLLISIALDNWELNRHLGIPLFIDKIFYFSAFLMVPALIILITYSTVSFFNSLHNSADRDKLGQSSRNNSDLNKKHLRENVEKFRDLYQQKTAEELTRILTDKRYTEGAVEAARQILGERQNRS